MRTLNLGILAHLDTGKTTLTGRLHAADVIDEIGSVDEGSTQTDSLPLKRQRGITVRSAVVSFVIDGVTVKLIDTAGHPDFIAGVERVLGVPDGAVLMVSAAEGVQAPIRGEGVLKCAFDVARYQPVGREIPTRPRTDHNPLDSKEYLLRVMRRTATKEGPNGDG